MLDLLLLLFVKIRLRNDLYCVGWGVKLYSNQTKLFVKNWHLFADRVSRKGNAIGRVRQSVCLFPLYCLNQLTFDLDILHVYGP